MTIYSLNKFQNCHIVLYMNINTTGLINIDYIDSQFVYIEPAVSMSPVAITSFPVTLINSTPMDSALVVHLIFTHTIDASIYFIIGSNNILIDGDNIPKVINAFSYSGLICNGTSEDIPYNLIIVRNITVSGNGTLATGAGWICGRYFGNCQMINCSSYLPINYGGGLFGSNCDTCTATNCFTTGEIYSGGGIFGNTCDNCTATSCHTTGNIDYGGGIFGQYTFGCSAILCYTTGIITSYAGGIFGTTCNQGKSNLTCTANKCYSTGPIGGIHLTSSLVFSCGGIFGPNCNESAENCICEAIDCYSLGDLYGSAGSGASGGIFANNCNAGSDTSVCVATGCFSAGKIGTYCGGIFYQGRHLEVNDCYSIGNIGPYGGGIVGYGSTDVTITHCYSVGNISDSGGGILGYGNSDCTLINCYAAGSITGTAGGLVGLSASAIILTNCYTVAEHLYDPGNNIVLFTITNCIAENGPWNNNNAVSTIEIDSDDHWTRTGVNFPPLLTLHSEIKRIPSGYDYAYIIGDMQEVIDDVITIKTVLGYYKDEQETDETINSNIYGYTIKDHDIDVTVELGTTRIQSNISTFVVTYRRYKSIWITNLEALKL